MEKSYSKTKLNPNSAIFMPAKLKKSAANQAAKNSEGSLSSKLSADVAEFVPTTRGIKLETNISAQPLTKRAQGLIPIMSTMVISGKDVQPDNPRPKINLQALEVPKDPPPIFGKSHPTAENNSQASLIAAKLAHPPKDIILKPYQKTISHFYTDKATKDRLESNKLAQSVFIDNNIPSTIHFYNSITPIPLPNQLYSLESHGLKTSLYKAFSTTDGKTYCIHRIHGCKALSTKSFAAVEVLLKVKHANIVQLYEAFTTHAFGDNSLCLIYDYYPNSTIFGNELVLGMAPSITEQQAWSFLIQILSAIRAMHKNGLSVNILDLGSVLCTAPNKYRLAWVGMSDILNNSRPEMLNASQKKDIYKLGVLVLKVLLNNFYVENDIMATMNTLKIRFSPDLIQLVSQLVLGNNNNIDTLLAPHVSKMFNELDNLNGNTDSLEEKLTLELENGRISRLIIKLNFIIGRPELRSDLRWSETGDRYLLTLFYGYVFHQVTANGEPVLDMAHIISNLNKLDAGSNEHVMLTSKDEKTCLIVSYSSIRKCLESTYSELLSK